MAQLVEVKCKIRGVAPLLMHRGGLANPLDKWARASKKVSAKRKKTDEDIEELARLDFMGSLYWDEENGVHIPAEAIEACIRDGAKKNKRGKDIQSGVFCNSNVASLQYEGPKEPQKLFDKGFFDTRAVSVNRSKVMRTRPRFNKWSCTFTLSVNTSVIDPEDVLAALEDAGAIKGLCDYRPRYGRFVVDEFEVH